jgi:hypothetical protein
VAELVGEREAASGWDVVRVHLDQAFRRIEQARDPVQVGLLDVQAQEVFRDRLDRDRELVRLVELVVARAQGVRPRIAVRRSGAAMCFCANCDDSC